MHRCEIRCKIAERTKKFYVAFLVHVLYPGEVIFIFIT